MLLLWLRDGGVVGLVRLMRQDRTGERNLDEVEKKI